MPKLNIALIGAGRRGGNAHLPVIAKLKDVYNLVVNVEPAFLWRFPAKKE